MFLYILALVTAGCSSGDDSSGRIDIWPALEKGGFVPYSYPLDLERNRARADHKGKPWLPRTIRADSGWRVTRHGWRATNESAVLSFWNRCSDSSQLALRHRLVSQGNTLADQPMDTSIRVLLNGAEIGVIEAAKGRSRSRFAIPAASDGAPSRLELKVLQGWASSDASEKQFWLLGLRVVCGELGSKRPDGPSVVMDQTTKSLKVNQAGSFVLPLNVPDEATELRLQTRASDQKGAQTGGQVGIFALQNEIDRKELGSIAENQDSSRSDGWQDGAIPMEAIAGTRTFLMLDVDLPAGSAGLEIRNLELLTTGSTNITDKASKPTAKVTAHPDVILIILDAARGDRFPGAGYFRQTVPHITALAGEALVYRNAFSECPTTSCSIPALITGISFLPGIKVRGGQQLSPDVTTLAEYLKAVGYRAVSLSSTPNHSTAHNLHQGYDEFHELWNRKLANYGPEQLSRLADEILQQQPTDEPLLLQLHYKPPHWPYKPGPEFDKFSDPNYDGPLDLGTALKYYTKRAAQLTEQDLEQMVGLYDGNLLRADAAVGKVLESLRRTGRLENSIVVITSDHGEAFMEHGRLGHNSTLFDEMIHVPLVIRLPGGRVPDQADPDRLASLLDVVPTILGQIGIFPSTAIDGIDLINTPVVATRPRVLFLHRLGDKLLGARTPTWKSIGSPKGDSQMLFRIDQDPDELRNRLVENPLIYAGLALQMRNHLRAAKATGPVGDTVEITPEAEDALHALGYLN